MTTEETMKMEDRMMIPFFQKQPISIARGQGVEVWDEEGRRYLDFTAGWGVTCIGHAAPVIQQALAEQSARILQNPNSGLTYSPPRARLLAAMREILPPNLTRVFFASSGAEANDAVIKLARKVTGRMDVISTHQSFHGRTISTASATGQSKHRDKFNPLMPNYRFVEFADPADLERALDDKVAAFILEPIQGEGGVRVPARDYLKRAERLCHQNGSLLIVDEIQTGFCRTGPFFVTADLGVEADFMTMAKGIAGGFPFGAFATTAAVAAKVDHGDHGGTYCGNPLGCAVSAAVITYLREHNIPVHVEKMGRVVLDELRQWKKEYPEAVTDIRGQGLLVLMELRDEQTAGRVADLCLANGLFVRQTKGNGIRIFPALTITREELAEGLAILKNALRMAVDQ